MSMPPIETRREFTRHALQSLTALALIEGLAAHRLFGKDVTPIVDAWFKELQAILSKSSVFNSTERSARA